MKQEYNYTELQNLVYKYDIPFNQVLKDADMISAVTNNVIESLDTYYEERYGRK